jgi:hypothetical protein
MTSKIRLSAPVVEKERSCIGQVSSYAVAWSPAVPSAYAKDSPSAWCQYYSRSIQIWLKLKVFEPFFGFRIPNAAFGFGSYLSPAVWQRLNALPVVNQSLAGIFWCSIPWIVPRGGTSGTSCHTCSERASDQATMSSEDGTGKTFGRSATTPNSDRCIRSSACPQSVIASTFLSPSDNADDLLPSLNFRRGLSCHDIPRDDRS